jgi:PAS domain S-box-containing protein
MANPRPTRTQLLAEVDALRQQVAHLTAAAAVQQRTAEALHHAQLYAQSLIETVREPLVVLAADFRVISANRAFYRFFHTTPEDTEHALFYGLGVGRWNVPQLRRLLEEILPQNTAFDDFEMEITLPSGTRKTMLLNARRVEPLNDHPPMILLALEDITEQRRAERLSQQKGIWLDVTLTSIGDAVMATDTAAAITFMNPEAERLTGWTAQEALGRDVEEVLRLINAATRLAIESPIRRVLREGVVVGLANHTLLLARDGREIPVADSGAPIRGKEGTLYGVVMVFRDITEREELEQNLRNAKETVEEASRVKDEFLATMSHELRTPLGVIMGYLDLLRDGAFGPLPPEQSGVLRLMDRNARELLDLVSAILETSRLDAGGVQVLKQEVQVAEVLAALEHELEGLREQSGLVFTWKIAINLPPVETDREKLRTILKNLIGNAVKFTAQGSITVEAQGEEGGMEISVTDTGRGISPEVLPHIFEPFYQSPEHEQQVARGAGLGLHIVQRFLGLLGGTITVDSTLGQGSIFRVRLPTTFQTPHAGGAEGETASTNRP